MSDPFSNPQSSPWSEGSPPPPDPQGWGQPGSGQWGQPPQGDQWGQAPQGDQWGQAPQGDQWGQYGQPPPQKGSSAGKIIAIVVGVIALLVIVVIAAVVFLVARVGDEVGGIIEQVEEGFVEGFEDLPSAGGVPEGPRLLQTTGQVPSNGTESVTFTVERAGPVQIDVLGRDGFDPVAALLDDAGSTIDEDDDGGSGLDSRIVRNLDPGRYTVEVRGFAGNSGPFEIIVTQR